MRVISDVKVHNVQLIRIKLELELPSNDVFNQTASENQSNKH